MITGERKGNSWTCANALICEVSLLRLPLSTLSSAIKHLLMVHVVLWIAVQLVLFTSYWATLKPSNQNNNNNERQYFTTVALMLSSLLPIGADKLQIQHIYLVIYLFIHVFIYLFYKYRCLATLYLARTLLLTHYFLVVT